MSRSQMVEDADLSRIYAYCQNDPDVYSILRRLVSYGVAPEVDSPLGPGKSSYTQRLVAAKDTKVGDVWVNRKSRRTATVLATDGRNIKLRHQLGQVTVKWYAYLASEFELRASAGGEA